MQIATLSSKFQITIPSIARKRLGLQAGRGLRVVVKSDRIELVPEEPISALRGLLAGHSAQVPREADRA
jgi:AbrB family looped-hinge helix DNA binding protein